MSEVLLRHYYRHATSIGSLPLGFLIRAHRSSDGTPLIICNICTASLRHTEKETFTHSINNFLGQHHYNLLKYTYLIWNDEARQAYLEAEPWGGETLESFVHKTRGAHHGLPEQDIWLILAQIVSGIHFLCSTHSSGEVFALLSPNTILITSDCRLKLCIYGEWICHLHSLYKEKMTGQALILKELQDIISYLTGGQLNTYSEILHDFYTDCERPSASLRAKTLNFIRFPEVQQSLAIARSRAGLFIHLPSKPSSSSTMLSNLSARDPNAEPEPDKTVAPLGLVTTNNESISIDTASFDMLSRRSGSVSSSSEPEPDELTQAAMNCISTYESGTVHIPFNTLEAMICTGDVLAVKSNIWVLLNHNLLAEAFHLVLSMKNGSIIAELIEFAEEHKLKLRLPVQQGKPVENQTDLMNSIHAKDFQLQEKHKLDLGKIYGSQSSCYCTALMTAAFYGYDEALIQLLGELGIYDYYGLTALQYGCLNASWSRIRYLIPEMRMSRVTWLMIYAALGDSCNVEKHIAELHKQTYYGYTALMFAACNNHIDCVKLLLKEVGSKTQNGRTALIWAARKGCLPCIEVLYPYEKDLFANDGSTALMAAVEGQFFECVKALISQAGMRNLDGCTALMWAAQMGSVDILRLLIDKEAGYQNKNGLSALMLAAYADKHECVEFLAAWESKLVKPGAHTALMLAAKNGHHRCVRHLLLYEGGIQDENGCTALMYAAEECHFECVSILAAKEFEIKDNAKRTALMRVRRRANDASFSRKEDVQKCLDILTDLLKPRGQSVTSPMDLGAAIN